MIPHIFNCRVNKEWRPKRPACRLQAKKSHNRPLKDGIRFMVIIFKIATLYSPLKLFVPASGIFAFFGIGYYLYTFITIGRFTSMTLLLLSAAVIIFLIGLISEQITALFYKDLV